MYEYCEFVIDEFCLCDVFCVGEWIVVLYDDYDFVFE